MGFSKDGWVSVWSGWSTGDQDKDVLRDLCGVDYYDLDFQENVVSKNWETVPLESLIDKLSYIGSYRTQLLAAANKKKILDAKYVVMQLDYKYDPKKVTKSIAPDPVFLGAFKWST